MPVDPELVSFISSYRVGFLPPVPGSLAPGELYLEVGNGDFPPKLWSGVPDKGVAMLVAGAEIIKAEPPVIVTTPYASQNGGVLNCTMGTWEGTPSAYAYRWMINGMVASEGAQHVITTDDIGQAAVCIVTATNAIGTTEGPPSNEVTVAAPA